MLKNEDLKQISKAQTLLCMIWQYSIDSDELYEKTGITTKDIHICMRALSHIHTVETLNTLYEITHKKISHQKPYRYRPYKYGKHAMKGGK